MLYCYYCPSDDVLLPLSDCNMEFDDAYHINNSIRAFPCELCGENDKILIWKQKHDQCGYLCQNCWNKFQKRIKQIF